ncbi:MAG: hypothetical protein JWQ40_945 [Segetibacter sp.]|jgi:hypothetical protein|nr:hypothetical protein [Segetibacter sp.]
MKKILIAVLLLVSVRLFAQDINVISKEALNLERSLKEEQALDKYKQVLTAEPLNLQALIKASELSIAMGGRHPDKKVKTDYFNLAKDYSDKALSVDSNSADANYVRSVAAWKLSEVEQENKKVLADVKEAYIYANRAVSINPNHGKANYALGKWHYDLVTVNWAKKAAANVLYGGGIPKASLEVAFKYMEKCKTLEPYFVRNFLDLGKAYKYDHKPAKAIEVLSQLVKLPNRTGDDAALKAEGKTLLSEMQ